MLAGVSVVLITALDHPVHIGSAQPVDPAQPPGPGATDDPNAGDSRLPAEPCTGRSVQGPVEQTRWGPVQVAAIVRANGTVCGLSTIETPSDQRRSVQINDYAVPILNTRAAAVGNATFQGVSGATVTSDGYRASLQAIIDG